MKKAIFTNEALGLLFAALQQLIHSGIGVSDGLMLLRQDEPEEALGAILEEMAARVDEGSSLSAAAVESGAFPAYVTGLLAVGEKTGQLEDTLGALGDYYLGRARLQRQVKQALLYPAVLLAVLLAVTVVLLVWVLPVFDRVYAGLGSGLSGVAGAMLHFGIWLKGALPFIGIALALMVILLSLPGVRNALGEKIRKKLPCRGVPGILAKARFVQALSLGIRSGMAASEAVELAMALTENEIFQSSCRQCLTAVEKGESLSSALRGAGLLDAARCRLLEAGERSGSSEVLLQRITEQLLEESEDALLRQVSRIEPAMVAVVCLLIGVVLLSVMLPLMDIMSAIG